MKLEIAASLTIVGVAAIASADTKVWTGLGADAKASTAANWQSGAAPVAGDGKGIFFPSATGAIVNDIPGLTPATITFGTGIGQLSISGETFAGVTLLNADASQKTVTVRDDRLGQTLTLELGKITTLPNRFEGLLRYQDKRYSFSEQPLRLDGETHITPMLYEGRLYLLQQTEGKQPCMWKLQKP